MPGRTTGGRMRSALSALAASVLFATLAGCGALGGSDAPPEGGTGGGAGGLEQTSLQVGVLPIVDVAALHRANTAGYFQQEGLTVELIQIQGGAVAVPQLVSGDLDMTWSNWTALFQAQAQGVGDFKLINAGYEAGPNTFLIMTPPGSAIRTPQDLAGKRIAVNTFRNIVELTARSALVTNGVDPNGVQFVDIPFPDMIPALQNGQIDAAVLLEPFITQAATGFGAVSVLDAASGPTDGIPIAGVGVTAGFAEENPNTVAAFQRALDKAQADLADRSVVEETLPTYSSITADTASLLNLGTWPTSLDATRLQRVADLMREFGVLTEPLDVAPMIQQSGG